MTYIQHTEELQDKRESELEEEEEEDFYSNRFFLTLILLLQRDFFITRFVTIIF